MKSPNPIISVIIPIYNVEDYLRDTLQSVVVQNIGFINNIEIILVNDGSTDDSSAICREYKKRYPNNIQYIEQKNMGVSFARNRGLDAAKGKYVHFFDSDDLISPNAYSSLLSLMNKHEDEIDFAALEIEFFEARLGTHPLNYKFTAKRVVNVDEEPDAIILHMATCLIRRTAIEHKFDSSIKISEDMKFLSKILLKNKRYGIVNDARYYYRKRKADNSAIDRAQKDPSYYLVTPHKVYSQILNDWTHEDGIHPYAQWMVMYDLQWRLQQKSQKVLDSVDEKAYKKIIWKLLTKIDDSIIVAQRHLAVAYKEYALKIKHGKDIKRRLQKDWPILYKNLNPRVQIEFADYSVKNNMLTIECSIQEGTDTFAIDAKIDGESVEKQTIDVVYRKNLFLGDVIYSGQPFTVSIPIKGGDRDLIFYIEGTNKPLQVLTKRQSSIPNVRHAYRVFPGILLSHSGDRLTIRTWSILRHLIQEIKWDIRLFLSLRLQFAAKKLRDMIRSTLKSKIEPKEFIYSILLPIISALRNCFTIGYRFLYYFTKPFFKKDLWLISDRLMAAGDSGEALYEYVIQQNNLTINAYFVISKKSPDYIRLKKCGVRVIDGHSLRYRLLFLHASKIISSHADDYVVNPFSYRVHFLNDLFHFDFVFLQHGIIRNDLSSWLNRYNKNIRLFITSTQQEYDSILDYPYYYTKEKLLLSGLPRYDLLENDPQSKLILAPTWRHDLALSAPVIKGQRSYNPEFKKTEYFKFYDKLINDPELHKALNAHGMTAEFYLHPSFEVQVGDFTQNDLFTIKDFPYDYRMAFREGSVLVSDYSSVIFDFIYLMKPIVYTQFDQDTFYNNHIYTRGYMDDERDGFGPVAKTYKQAVKSIIAVIDGDCIMKKKYKERAKNFFAWHDKNNTKRVYDAIVALDEYE